jgi:hypothetical protein
LLPARVLGCGSPATCWRRLTEWATAGVFDQLHLKVLDRLGDQDQLDWSRASVDSASVPPIRTSRAAAVPARQGPCRQGLRQPRQPRRPATAWDHRADRPPWDRIIDQAGTASLAGGTVAVLVELLAAAAGAVDRDSGRWFAFVLVACAVVCFNRL